MHNIGIIGFGKIALAHQKAFEYLGNPINFSVNRSEAGRQKAKAAGIRRVYSDMHEAINKEQPDGLLITVDFRNLYPVAKALIPYGIPILLEKPSGVSLEEHQELGTLAKANGNKVQLGVNRRFYSVFNKAIKDIGGREKITTVDIEWSEPPRKLIERGMTQEDIGKIIYGNSIHGIDLLCWLVGQITTPTIHAKSWGTPFRWYMRTNGISDQGILYSFHSSWDYFVGWKLVIGTEQKRYQFAPLETCQVQEGRQNNYHIEPSEEDAQLKAGFYGQSKAFIALMEGGANHAPIASADSAMQLCDQFYNALWSSR